MQRPNADAGPGFENSTNSVQHNHKKRPQKLCLHWFKVFVDWKIGKCVVDELDESTGKACVLKGIRNQFLARPVSCSEGSGCVIEADGKTVSPVCLLPGIDYRFASASLRA